MLMDWSRHYRENVRGWGGDGDGCDRDGVGMGKILWGWGGYGENKLSPCSSLVRPTVASWYQSDCR